MTTYDPISLKDYTTMHLGGQAREFTSVTSVEEVIAAYSHAKKNNLRFFVLGGGSNTLAHDEGFSGVIIHNEIMGIDEIAHDDTSIAYRVGAGENWDNFVAYTVERNLSGIEALSSIPGTVGAAPVQNIGAYGQEVATTIQSVDAYDTHSLAIVTIPADECAFGYRDSIFRGKDAGRYIITHVTFQLSTLPPSPPFYKPVQEYFDAHGIKDYAPADVRNAVAAIRREKLPDPTLQPNTGSFFKNAIVPVAVLEAIKERYPEVPSYDMPNGLVKIPTGWLIEKAGLKGKVLHGMKVHDKNALVLINESAQSYHDLAAAREEIIAAVKSMFDITIEQEPLELGD